MNRRLTEKKIYVTFQYKKMFHLTIRVRNKLRDCSPWHYPRLGLGGPSPWALACRVFSGTPGPPPTDAINTSPVLMAHNFSRHCQCPLGIQMAPTENQGTTQSMLIKWSVTRPEALTKNSLLILSGQFCICPKTSSQKTITNSPGHTYTSDSASMERW